ncbi:MAG: HlyD family efflux transporter periplasmic adaptor subunit [Bacteroidales bacterium]|nr:HlyD family efflux transporter periplasmic adaptor subunit [Bacteroidales bacterium]
MNRLLNLLTVLLIPIITFTSCNQNGTSSDAFGNFEATEIMVSALASGQLTSFNIQEGESLEANQVIGLVDTIDLSLRKAQLFSQKQAILSRMVAVNAQIAVNDQQLVNARVDQERIHNLLADRAATVKQKDDIDGSIKLIERQMAATRAQLESIRSEATALDSQVTQINESIRKSTIINPQKGTVLSKYAEPGEVISFGKPLYKLADLSVLELKVYVSGGQLSNFAIGDEVDVIIDKSKNELAQLKGKVSWISSTAEFTPKTIQTRDERVELVYAAKVRVNNNGQLKIGMPGEILFKR